MNFKPQWRHCSWNNVPPTTPEDSFSSLVETILPAKWRKKSFFSSSFHLIEIEEERRSQDSQPKSFMTNRVEHKSQDEIMISTGNTHTHVQRSSSSFTLTFWATNTDESRTTNNQRTKSCSRGKWSRIYYYSGATLALSTIFSFHLVPQYFFFRSLIFVLHSGSKVQYFMWKWTLNYLRMNAENNRIIMVGEEAKNEEKKNARFLTAEMCF